MSGGAAARVSTDAFTVAFVAYLVAMLAAFHHLAFRRRSAWTLSIALTGAGALAHLVSVVARGIAAGRIPLGNMYEYSLALSLLVVLAYLGLVEWRAGVRTVGGFVLAFVLLTLAVAALFLHVGPAPLVPALNSYWRQVHVGSMIVSSALLALGGILTILYLVKEAGERRRAARLRPIAGAGVDLGTVPELQLDGGTVTEASVPRRGILPPAEVLDRLAHRTIAFAFPIWTFGIITGAIWAERAWGRYWGWDPKETWSFVTWVIFAGYLHARATAGWSGRRAAVIALVGFVSLLVTYYAVNLWIVGLHSYAT